MHIDKLTSVARQDRFENYLPGISIDLCVLGFHENKLKILLIRWEKLDFWSLPGGFICVNESVDAAAKWILQERTGLDNIFLEQFKVFGEVNRTNSAEHKTVIQNSGLDNEIKAFLLKRTISVGYYALVDFSKATPATAKLIADCRWWDVHAVPPLILDHAEILSSARRALQLHLINKPIGYNLLPEKFTMGELRRLYETILGKPIDRRNFEKKMLKLGILERLEEVKSGVTYKPPFLYKFNPIKYQELLNADFGFGF